MTKDGETPEGGKDSGASDDSTAPPPQADVSALMAQLQELQTKIASLSPSSEAEVNKEEKAEADPLHGKYADSLKRDLGELYEPDWDKIPLGERIKTMEIALTVRKNAQIKNKQKEGKVPAGSPAGDNKAAVFLNPRRDYKALRKAILK